MSYNNNNNLLQVEINGKKKQVYYDANGIKLPVLVEENGELFCKLSEGGIVSVNPYLKVKIEVAGEIIQFNGNSKLYTAENITATCRDYKEICNFDIESLNTQNFYKTDAATNFSEKINDFQIQDEKVVVNTQQIVTQQTNNQLHNPTNSISSNELNENEEVIINEQPGDNLTKKLTNELIKQMKKEVEKLQKQYKQQQKAKQKTGAYTKMRETEETTEVEQTEETEAMKLLKQIYNTNYKGLLGIGMGNHISYNESKDIKGDKYVFEITNKENKTEKIYFNKKSKMKELDNLISACNDLIAKQILKTNEDGLIL